MQAADEVDRDDDHGSAEGIVRPDDRDKDRAWWRCRGCNCYLYSEEHAKECPYVDIVVCSNEVAQKLLADCMWQVGAIEEEEMEAKRAAEEEDDEEKQRRVDAQTAQEW